MGDLARIEEDLAVKTRSLALETQCMDTRQKLPLVLHDGSQPQVDTTAITEGVAAIQPPSQVVEESPKSAMKMSRDGEKKTLAFSDEVAETTQIKPQSVMGDLGTTTYNIAYEDSTRSIRGKDLERTLGRYKEVLVQ